jgi:hypothetical protein
MKIKTTLLLFLALVLGGSITARLEAKDLNTSVCLMWPKSLSVPLNSEIHMRLRFDDGLSQNIRPDLKLTPAHPAVSEVVTRSAKDGRVDVDIIIRGDVLQLELDRFQNSPDLSNQSLVIQVFDIDIITVDNISGVFETSSGNGQHNARITDVNVLPNSEEAGSSTAYAAVAPVIAATVSPVVQSTQTGASNTSFSASATRNTNTLQLYPNPVQSGMVTLQIDGQFSKQHVQIFNALGAIVAEKAVGVGEQVVQLNTDQLVSGIYFVRFELDGKPQVRKLQVKR